MSDTRIGDKEDKVFYRKQKGNFQAEYFKYNNACSGIYSITNLDNGKLYIGQAQNYRDRVSQHRRELRKGDHFSKYLCRAYCKGQNLLMQLIETCSIDKLDEREIFWIQFLDTMAPDGYNLTIGGKSPRGMKHTQETNDKKRKWMLEYCKTNKVNNSDRYIEIVGYNMDGNFVSEYESIAKASEQCNIPISTISGNLTGRKPSAGSKMIFRYKTDEYPLTIEVVPINSYRINGGLKYPVDQYTIDGNFIKRWVNSNELLSHLAMTQHNFNQRAYRGNGTLIVNDFKYVRYVGH